MPLRILFLAQCAGLQPNVPSQHISGPISFSTTDSLPPIPGYPGAAWAVSNDTSLLTSLLTAMVYQMGRIANPDIIPKLGTIDGIRRNAAIHVCVDRCPDNRAVALRPGVVGEKHPTGLKSLNARLRLLYEARRLPGGSC